MEPIDKNMIRQVLMNLMNEMGLTREAIRREMDNVIVETARAYLGNLFQTGFLEKLVGAEVNRLLSRSPFVFELPLEQIVTKVAREQVAALIKKHVSIIVNPPQESQP